jgi:hypothetical protein
VTSTGLVTQRLTVETTKERIRARDEGGGQMSVRTVALALAALAALVGATVSYASAPRGSRSNPVPVRTTVPIPDSEGWKFRVNRSVPNATAVVLATSSFNSPPKPGRQFYMINVSATYTGKVIESASIGLTIQAVGRSNVAYSFFNSCARAIPNGFDDQKAVHSGGRITGNICFSVKKTDVSSLLVTAHPGISFKDILIFFKTH